MLIRKLGRTLLSRGIGLLLGAIVPLGQCFAGVETPVESPKRADISARAEFHVASVKQLIHEMHRSRAGGFATELWNILLESSENTSKGFNHEELQKMLAQLHSWNDTALHGATFAPDTEGKSRWAFQVDWPIAELHERVKAILASDTAKDLLRGVALKERDGGGFVIKLPDSNLAFLIPVGGRQSIIASHADLVPPTDFIKLESGDGTSAGAPLVTCRLNLASTEKDSGATFFSNFSVLTAVTYAGRVDSDGDWDETIQLAFPPISGMGVKMFLGRVKQSFFVPNEAFFAGAFNSTVAPGMLEGMAGFGPQFMVSDSGQFEMVGAESLGPVSSRMDSELCLTVLPGKGFLPAPDLVFQMKSRDPDKFAEDVRKAVEEVNKIYRMRDQKEPWKEVTIRDRTVFWNDGGQRGSFMMPLTMHPVLFMTKETDAKGKEKDFLVLGWTSTSPEGFVRRWLDLPRNKDSRFLPSGTKTDGEAWINWKQVYKWTLPYFNVGLNTGGIRTLFPKPEAINEKLSDASVKLDLNYTGLSAKHKGPIPLGTIALPSMLAASLVEDSGASDLSRERTASQQLRVLYHHCKLFHKDLGRWPAELQELDGYVDFAGNPQLLHLRLSAKKEWSEWLDSIFEMPKDEKEKEEDEEFKFDDDLYVFNWGKDKWSLGYAPKTFEHLESLYIDQDGLIHRKERTVEKQAVAPAAAPESGPAEVAKAAVEEPKEQAP